MKASLEACNAEIWLISVNSLNGGQVVGVASTVSSWVNTVYQEIADGV
jgi:hypothetical protein